MFYKIIDSPIGPYLLVENGKGISAVEHLETETSESRKAALGEAQEKDTPLLMEASRQLTEYFQGERQTFRLPLDTSGTPFQEKVWAALREIPYGEVRTYKEIAVKAGSPKAVRAVGMANNRNPLSILSPCHRVIGSNGALVGYAGGLQVKEFLLNLEMENQYRNEPHSEKNENSKESHLPVREDK